MCTHIVAIQKYHGGKAVPSSLGSFTYCLVVIASNSNRGKLLHICYTNESTCGADASVLWPNALTSFGRGD